MKKYIKYLLVFLAGAFTYALFNDKNFRNAFINILTFRWVVIGFPKKRDTPSQFTYHKDPKKLPKGYKRYWPPLHPGGRHHDWDELDKEALQMIETESISFKECWGRMKYKYLAPKASYNNEELRQAYEAFYKRIARRADKTLS